MGSIEVTRRSQIVIIPLSSMGHTIPLIHLTILLLKRNIKITFFTTPRNSQFVRDSLRNTAATIVDLLPIDAAGTVGSTVDNPQSKDKFQSMVSLMSCLNTIAVLQAHFEQVLRALPNVGCIISDAFLRWTLPSAVKLGIPRLAFYGMSNYSLTIAITARHFGLHTAMEDSDGTLSLPCFPALKLTGRDLGSVFKAMQERDWKLKLVEETDNCTMNSQGLIVNSFYEIESSYADYWNSEFKPRAWYIGPLCATNGGAKPLNEPQLLQWLDEKLAKSRPVLYISFGTEVEVPAAQLQEIAQGLELSRVDFLWVLRNSDANWGAGFEERMAERGLVVRHLIQQQEVLEHESVQGFMSHCGWNSVVETITAKVPLLAWPMAAEQHLNAKMVDEELKIGLRIPAKTGEYAEAPVGAEVVEKMVRELMEGEKGKVARDNAKEVGEAAIKAVEQGGSSYKTLDLLINEYCGKE